MTARATRVYGSHSVNLRCRSGAGRKHKQRPGAGPRHDLAFTDRVLVTLVHLRHQLPHAALAELYGLERSTITRAVGGIRPLPAARGFTVPDRTGVPAAHPGRCVRICRGRRRHLAERRHDHTAVRTKGIAEQFRLHPGVKNEVDRGYRGPANARRGPGAAEAQGRSVRGDPP
ncbi:helix-turn-helix domain-containing protein [Streptomyces monashensis]|uniref:helix-turn-helix domain-containing protein n=1 Tax=Streptomyces monashensis TaxID=1678012 RepID=UPI003F5418C3